MTASARPAVSANPFGALLAVKWTRPALAVKWTRPMPSAGPVWAAALTS